MDLLNQIIRQPVDPDYAVVATRGAPPPHVRWGLMLVAILVGAMFAVATVQTNRTAPAISVERTELINRIRTAENAQDALRDRAATLDGEITTLQGAALGTDDQAGSLKRSMSTLDPIVGTVAVTGPGLQITVDDADGTTDSTRDQVLDVDLRTMVNGLWQSGAEAVAINGHRLSALTAIRGAGDAITVDYRSLSRPYRVQAIGDPLTIQARFVESAGGIWWNDLAQNRGMRYQTSSVEDITLAADPGIGLRYAKKAPL